VLASTGLALTAGAAATRVGADRPEANRSVVDPPPLRWTEVYDVSERDSVTAVTTTENLVVGAGSTAGGDGEVPWVFAVDRHGRGQWQRSLTAGEDPRALDVAPGHDGGVVVCGELRPDDASNDAFLARLDATGAVQWRTTVDPPLAEAAAFGVVRAPSGSGYLVAGGTRNDDRTMSLLARVDGSGSVQWSREVTEGTRAVLYAIESTTDGVVCCGLAQPETEGDKVAPLEGWVTAFDGEGTRQWSRTHRVETDGEPARFNFLRDVVPTADGFLVVGYSRPPGTAGQVGWAVATDGRGERTGQFVGELGDSVRSTGLDNVVEHDGEYVAVGTVTTEEDTSEFLYLALDGGVSQTWRNSQSVAASGRALAATSGLDGGLYTFGNVATESGATFGSVAGVKLGGDPQPTPRPTPTETPTATPEPTETPSPSPTPTPTPEGVTDTPTPTAASGGDDDTTSGSGPGFGVVGTLAALGAGALARRLPDDDTE
jgi:PGF-CTERM protein